VGVASNTSKQDILEKDNLLKESLEAQQVLTQQVRPAKDILALEKAWLGSDPTLFLCFRSTKDCLQALRAKQKLFSRPNRIFLNKDLSKSQVAELKCSKELVIAAQ
jgi:hypothetical protein